MRKFNSKTLCAKWISETPFHVVRCVLGTFITNRIELATFVTNSKRLSDWIRIQCRWISSKWNSVNGGSSWNWESAEIPEVTSLESKESDSAAARVSIVQYRRASQRQSIRRDRSSMMSARSPKSHSMRKSTMSGRMRWRKFRSSLVSVTSSTPRARASFFEDASIMENTTSMRKRRMNKNQIANHVMSLLPTRARINDLAARFTSNALPVLVRVFRPDALRVVSEVRHVRECLQRMISGQSDTSQDLHDLHESTIPSSWNVLMTQMSPKKWCETIDEHISALVEICFDEKKDVVATTSHALCLDHLSRPSRTLHLLSRVLLMKQDGVDLIIRGSVKGNKGLLLRGQGQINEEESEEVVLRLFASPHEISDYWVKCPSSSISSIHAVRWTTKKIARFNALDDDVLIELVD